MTFETEKNKIFTLWNNSIENQFKIIRSDSNRKIIFTKIKELNRTIQSFKNIIDFSSDWLNADIQYDSSTNQIFQIFKDFSIEINGIHKSLIPYIQSKVVYRTSDGIPSVPIPDTPLVEGTPFDEFLDELDFNDFIEIRDILTNNHRNIIYTCSIFMENSDGLPEGLQFKFYITLFNPRTYTSN